MSKPRNNHLHGWLLEEAGGQFVEAIIANGHPDNPVVYYTTDPEKALSYTRFGAVEARALQLGLMIRKFDTDIKTGKRVLKGYE